jgi:hypothetical protein
VCWLASYLKSSVFILEHAEIQENALRELCAIKCLPGSVPTMEETLGTVYRQ